MIKITQEKNSREIHEFPDWQGPPSIQAKEVKTRMSPKHLITSCHQVFTISTPLCLSITTLQGWYWAQHSLNHFFLMSCLPTPQAYTIQRKTFLLNIVYFQECESESPSSLHAWWNISKQEWVTNGAVVSGFSVLGGLIPPLISSPKWLNMPQGNMSCEAQRVRHS